MHPDLQQAYWSLEKRLTPGLRSAQAIYAELLDAYVDGETLWLDVGCGHQLFEPWIATEERLVRRAKMVVGVDCDYSSIKRHRTLKDRIVSSGLPFRAGSFSLITANMVLEHLGSPQEFLGDARRLLCAGGHLIVHTPNARHWHVWASRILPHVLKQKLVRLTEGRSENDVYPTYYRANTPGALADTAVASGLQIESMMLCDTSATSRMYLGPLAIVDLLIVRFSRHERFAKLRSNMIAVFQAQA